LVRVGVTSFGLPEHLLNEWPSRPAATEERPPLTNAVNLQESKPCRIKFAAGALGFCLSGSDHVHGGSSATAVFSSVFNSGIGQKDGWSIVPDNFASTFTVVAVRTLVDATWLNQKDNFLPPDEDRPGWLQFVLDAAVYVLFGTKNQTSSLGNVNWNNKTWDIKNEFFWMTPAELAEAPGLPYPLYTQCQREKPRFVAKWLQDKTFSPDAQKVLELGKKLVVVSAGQRVNAEPKYQLATRWDAGWYQIRMGLYGKKVPFEKTAEMIETYQEFKEAHKVLKERLQPLIYELGFLQRPFLFEEKE
jgi:hypothetical protein